MTSGHLNFSCELLINDLSEPSNEMILVDLQLN